ncbi:MAG: thymidine phosphorylase [Calditrichia bacterium]
MSPYEIIAIKRDGKTLSPNQITEFIAAYMRGDVTDYQLTALLMAIYLRGMNFEETGALTKAYINSGVMVSFKDIPGIKVDKHSTGGVGDKVSLILAPLVASLGVPVPMISGRGLGHSGGTLDKLESIPGFKTNLGLDDYRKLLKNHKLALIGQTAEIVPADKRIYALRDVTATVDCMPLIAASIMSKKIAEGIDALVLDVIRQRRIHENA